MKHEEVRVSIIMDQHSTSELKQQGDMHFSKYTANKMVHHIYGWNSTAHIHGWLLDVHDQTKARFKLNVLHSKFKHDGRASA